MQTVKQAEIARISNMLREHIDEPKMATDLCAKRILDGNYEKIPFFWRKTQNEVLLYAPNCTISYDVVTGELIKCGPSNMGLYLKTANKLVI